MHFFLSLKKNSKIQKIKNIFHNIKIDNLKDFFKEIINK